MSACENPINISMGVGVKSQVSTTGMPEAIKRVLALGVLTEARAQKISVPHQISIMGFGDVPFVEDMIPALTTVKINGAEIGRLAAQCLVDRAQGKAVEQHIVDVGFSIVSRESA
jgi:LacI family gluconate utilization system Gnt-I transcriptional repressor